MEETGFTVQPFNKYKKHSRIIIITFDKILAIVDFY
jgi:hypothetical protein